MSLILSGSDGLSDVDGSAATPAIRGTDANTGMFFPAADTIAFSEGGVESMRIDSSGNVGIGTNSPSGKLHVSSADIDGTSIRVANTSSSNSARAMLRFISTSSTFGAGVFQTNAAETAYSASTLNLYTFDSQPMAFGTNNAERIRITSTGDVGIGTSSPNRTFQVSNVTNSIVSVLTGSIEGVINATTANVNIGSASNHVLAISTNSAERMRIDTTGNVGIGTSSPTAQLATVGNVNIGNNSSTNPFSYLRFGCSQYGASDIRPVDYGSHTSGLAFYTDGTADTTINPTERMRITSGGRVELSSLGVFRLQTGSTTMDCTPTAGATDSFVWNLSNASIFAWSQSGTERMRIDSSGNLLIKTTTAGGIGTTIYGQFGNQGLITINSSATSADVMYFQYNGSIVGRIATTTTATSFVTSSDYRLKENIAPMTGALDKVALLKPCTYTWKSNGEDSQGFIAHELQEVVPECVTGEKDAVNEDGSIKPQGIDTSFLVATLTAAIQELNAKLDAQAVEIAALKAK
jgi:hypothetical protein